MTAMSSEVAPTRVNIPVDGVLSRPLVHGTDPVNLVEHILRLRVYESSYWQQYCFALNAADLVDRAAELEFIGSVSSETNKPTPFICLLVKMLQINPALDITKAMLDNQEFKYMRALAAMFVRMTARPADVYGLLEPLMVDYRKLRVQTKAGWELTTMDDFIDSLLEDESVISLALPRLALRSVLVQARMLPVERRSALQPKIDAGGPLDNESIPDLLADDDGVEVPSDSDDDLTMHEYIKEMSSAHEKKCNNESMENASVGFSQKLPIQICQDDDTVGDKKHRKSKKNKREKHDHSSERKDKNKDLFEADGLISQSVGVINDDEDEDALDPMALLKENSKKHSSKSKHEKKRKKGKRNHKEKEGLVIDEFSHDVQMDTTETKNEHRKRVHLSDDEEENENNSIGSRDEEKRRKKKKKNKKDHKSRKGLFIKGLKNTQDEGANM